MSTDDLCLPADLEQWVRQHAEYIGEPASAVIRAAVAAYRAQVGEAHLDMFGSSPYDPDPGEQPRAAGGSGG